MERKINYRAQLTLKAKTDEGEQWSHLLKMISNWINLKNPNDNTKSAIYRGVMSGDLTYNRDGVEVLVRSLAGEPGVDTPQFYEIKFAHLQTEGQLAGWRHWINDIGLERTVDGTFLFHMTNSFQTKNGFIGKIDDPIINSPNIIKQIVGDDQFRCYAGNSILKLNPIELTHDNVKSFLNLIFDKQRTVPIILISLDDHNEHLIDPNSLGSKVVGNAIVYYESEHSISQYTRSLSYFAEYRCSNGAVRIYLPGADHKLSSDFRRHRFYTAKQIIEETSIEIVKIIAESLVRRSTFIRPFGIQSIDSIEKIIIDNQLQEAIENNQSDEIINSYKLQVELVRKEIIAKDAELDSYCILYDEKESEITQVKSEVKNLEKKIYDLKQQNKQLTDNAEISSQYFVLDILPKNLKDLLSLLLKYYPKEIVILEEAFSSSEDFELRDLDKAWSLLRSIPEILFPIMFIGEGDKREQYVAQAGFDLSMTESKMTKGDKKLLELRTRTYCGNKIEINAHIGYGQKKPAMLRIYFFVSPEDRKIVIGHCGDHLDTFSTRSMS